MKELKELLPPAAKISGSCSTGYGEALIKAALQLDHGEVETMAHYYAAAFFSFQMWRLYFRYRRTRYEMYQDS